VYVIASIYETRVCTSRGILHAILVLLLTLTGSANGGGMPKTHLPSGMALLRTESGFPCILTARERVRRALWNAVPQHHSKNHGEDADEKDSREIVVSHVSTSSSA